MKKKRFLLISPESFKLFRLIVRNLEQLGFEVVHIENFGYNNFKYKSFYQRLNNFFRKTILFDRNFKDTLKQDFIYRKQYELLNQFSNYDFALVLRADFFSTSFIDSVCKKSDLSISFHFDGVDRDKRIFEYINMFDKFYVFDKEDVEKYPEQKFLYSPNFYFDSIVDPDPEQLDDLYDVYYVSTFNESRSLELIKLHKSLVQLFKRVCFVVVMNRQMENNIPLYITENMKVQYELVDFEEQLKYVANSEVIIDLVLADHSGYSFRILEGLGFNKKVITSNAKVLEADFYHPNNYFVLNDHNVSEVETFLKLPYVFIDNSIREKYNFSNWLMDKL